MAHTEISAEKIEAYRKTDYRFGEGSCAITLRIDRRSGELARLYAESGCMCGVFITAYNPFGRAHDNAANEASHERLRDELNQLPDRVIEGSGADPTGAWLAEKSFFALGVGLDAAMSLGMRHQQDAVVWTGEDAVPKLILLR